MRQGPTQHRPAPSWTRPITDRLSPAIKALVIGEGLIFLFFIMVPGWRGFLLEHVAMGAGFLGGELWQPISALALHVDPLSFIFCMLGVWFVGAAVERMTGTRRLVELLVIPGVLANVVTVLVAATVGQPIRAQGGLGDGLIALFVAMGRLYRGMPLSLLGGLTLEARRASAVLVGFSLVVTLAQGGFAESVGILVAAGVGYLLGGSGTLVGWFDRWRLHRVRRRLGVLEGGRPRDGKPRYMN